MKTYNHPSCWQLACIRQAVAVGLIVTMCCADLASAATTAYWDKYYNVKTGQPKPGTTPLPPVFTIYTQTQKTTGKVKIGYITGSGHPVWQLNQMYKQDKFSRDQGFDKPVLVTTGLNQKTIRTKMYTLKTNYRRTGVTLYDDNAEYRNQQERAAEIKSNYR